jgi:predicted nuclease of predicted toxin-antitoxin system
MKLLFDQNISFRIIPRIIEQFPGAKQVRELGLENQPDRKIWEYARQNDYAIVTFDADFFDLSSLLGHPPKIIWLRTHNRKTDEIATLILSKAEMISSFLNDPGYKELACLEVD